MSVDLTNEQNDSAVGPAEWAIVELMGHRRRAGRIAEAQRFGANLLRIDIPIEGDAFVTEFYGGSAIFSVRPTTEALARTAADSIGDPRPVMPASMRLAHIPGDTDEAADFNGGDLE